MQMKKKIIAVFGILLLLFVLIAGIQIEKRHSQNKIKTFTAFFSVLGEPRDEENEIKKLIAQKTGVSCEEIWLTGQTADTAADPRSSRSQRLMRPTAGKRAG